VDSGGRVLLVHEGVPALVAGPFGPARAYAELLRAGEDQDVLGRVARVPSTVDTLLYTSAMGARADAPPNVQWLIDVAHVLEAGTAPGPSEALERARRFRLVEPLRDTVTYLSRLVDSERVRSYARALADVRVRPRDDVAFRLGGSGVGVLGGLPFALAAHMRAGSEEPLWRVISTFPVYLARRWEVERVRALPGTAWKKARRRRYGGGRKRSASS
jgi:hypothetical protein